MTARTETSEGSSTNQYQLKDVDGDNIVDVDGNNLVVIGDFVDQETQRTPNN